MSGRLFPARLANSYQGSWVALWLLAPVLMIKTLIAFNFSGLNPFIAVGQVLQTVDGVPLDTFSVDARRAVIDSAAAWGAALFALCLVVWVVVIRYRAGLPLAILALLIEQLVRTGEGLINVVAGLASGATPVAAGGIINLAMAVLLAAAFVLSLLRVRAVGAES